MVPKTPDDGPAPPPASELRRWVQSRRLGQAVERSLVARERPAPEESVALAMQLADLVEWFDRDVAAGQDAAAEDQRVIEAWRRLRRHWPQVSR